MMDIIMIAVLLGSFSIIKIFADWCQSQVERKKW